MKKGEIPTCQPASMLLRSEPSKDPERIQTWERLNSFLTWMEGFQTFIVALTPYISWDACVYAIACYIGAWKNNKLINRKKKPEPIKEIMVFLLNSRFKSVKSTHQRQVYDHIRPPINAMTLRGWFTEAIYLYFLETFKACSINAFS